MPEKHCPDCKFTKPTSDFGKGTARKDGLHSICRACANARAAKRRRENPEAVKAAQERYLAANPDAVARRNKRFYAANREQQKARAKAWRLANPEKHKAATAAWREQNADRFKAIHKAWREADPERTKARRKRNYEDRKERELALAREYKAQHKERLAALSAAYHKANPEYGRFARSLRRAAERTAMPRWADRKAIKAVYAQAVELTVTTGLPHHVDHIVPLQSPLVCGLHVPCNLRVIPGAENMSKGNRHWPGMHIAMEAE